MKQLAKEVGMTESHFCRIFKKISGRTVGEYRKYLGTKPPLEDQMHISSSTTPSLVVDDWILEDDLMDWTSFQDCEYVADGLEDIDFSLFDEKWWHGQEVVNVDAGE